MRTVQPLDYRRPGAAPERRDALPFAASFVIGMGLFAVCCGIGWATRVGGAGGLVLVPLAAIGIASVMELALRMRGVVAGTVTAIGLCFLTCGVGIVLVCGHMKF
jgi:hypothetical protein